MSTITKEQIEQYANAARLIQVSDFDKGKLITVAPDHMLELARIALASLEAEVVAYMWDSDRKDVDAAGYYRPEHKIFAESSVKRYGGKVVTLYTVPPAPASVPDEIESTSGSDFDDYYCDGWNACRAAMLYGDENAESCSSNSPVIPDWQTQAEKMAELYGSSFVLFRNGESPQCADPSKVIISFTDEGLGHGAEAHFREIVNSSTNNCRENEETSTKCWCRTCRPVTISDMRFVVCPDCGNKRCPHANDHLNACTGSNEPGQEGSAYPAAPQQEVK